MEPMTSVHETATIARLMAAFAQRTGLSPAADNPQRYLWTNAFAVCNFLELFERTGDQEYRCVAIALIEQGGFLADFAAMRVVRAGSAASMRRRDAATPHWAVSGSASL